MNAGVKVFAGLTVAWESMLFASSSLSLGPVLVVPRSVAVQSPSTWSKSSDMGRGSSSAGSAKAGCFASTCSTSLGSLVLAYPSSPVLLLKMTWRPFRKTEDPEEVTRSRVFLPFVPVASAVHEGPATTVATEPARE